MFGQAKKYRYVPDRLMGLTYVEPINFRKHVTNFVWEMPNKINHVFPEIFGHYLRSKSFISFCLPHDMAHNTPHLDEEIMRAILDKPYNVV